MLRALTALICLALSLAPAAAIVGPPQPADPAVAPHVVLIAGTAGVCSGVAIAPDLVLTAAHCVAKGGNSYKLVALDGRRMVERTVERVAAHPQFAPRDDAPDVALVKLASKPPPNLVPVPFSDRRVPVSVGDRFIVAGFGLSNPKDRRTAGKLRMATLIATGKPNTQIINLVDPDTLGEKSGLGVCNGDSGGPVFEQRDGKLALVGIISWTAGPESEPMCGYISGVIPLPRYHYWIVETAAKLGSSLEP
jgi:secreted trypsin-like serine protease